MYIFSLSLICISSAMLTYLTQRLILKVSAEPQYHPVVFMIVLWFIPILGLVVSLAVLLLEYLSNNKNGREVRELDYKKIFKV